MAGNGPAPKSERSRARDNHSFDKLVDDGTVYGEPLPEHVLGGEFIDGVFVEVQWHAQTLKWWDAVRSYPMLKDEPAIGWQFLIDTALMHHTMWTNGRWEFASEIRLRVAKYAATPEDRLRLKVQVSKPAPELAPVDGQPEGGTVTSIKSRKSRLT